jgi:cell division protein FtsI (penicillin-binding protein 3)
MEQQYKVHMLGLPGLSFQREDRRFYPNGNIASHVVGFTDLDNKGIAGIEKEFDERLRKNNDPLVLSIDLRLQNILREELKKSVVEFRARGAAGIIMNAHTGELLAMVSLPDFDPHNMGGSAPDAKFNRNTSGMYEMGSTFKIFNTAMALETGRVRMNSSFDATQPLFVGGHKFADYHPKNRWLTVPEIFEYSSNIGSARMALEVGSKAQRNFFEHIGLFQPVDIELPEVGSPLVPARWGDLTTITASFGYGISVSPLHIARGVSAVVNGGYLPEVTLLKRKPNESGEGMRVISQSTSDQMRELMRLVVESGTGKNAEAKGYFVGGKTGTAEKSSTGGYAQKNLISSFAGAFPIQDPEYVVFAMVDEPQGNEATHGFATAAYVAAPVISRTVSRMAPILGLPPVLPQIQSIKDEYAGKNNPGNGANLASYATVTQ